MGTPFFNQCGPYIRQEGGPSKRKTRGADWLEKVEIIWRQRSKALWLNKGDQNTRYFHYKASQCIKKNSITRIKNEASHWRMGAECDAVIINYFSALFSSSRQ